MEKYNEKSLEELIQLAIKMENELRIIYRMIYKNPDYIHQDRIFSNLDQSERNSVTASTGAFWNSIRKKNKNIKTVDCFSCAQEWLECKGFKYAQLDISLHDIVMRFQQLKNKDIKNLET